MDKKKTDSIIFDIDGTLWDSTGVIARAWTEYLRTKENMDRELTPEYLMTLFGQLLSDIARNIFPDFPVEEQMRLIDGCCQAEHEALLRESAPLYEDLENTLEELSRRYPLYIVSNCQAGYIEVFLQSTGLGKYFKGHLCPGDTGNAKAENILQISRDFHLEAPVYVGDTMGDYQACQTAGVPFIFAAYGFGEVETPDARIEKPADLLTLLP